RAAAISPKGVSGRASSAACSTAGNTRAMRQRFAPAGLVATLFATLLAAWAVLSMSTAHAALFDDDEARKQITQLKNQAEARQKSIEDRLSAIDAKLGQMDS